jgi:anti-sigma-K factor RskA
VAAVVIAAFGVMEWRTASQLERDLAATREEISKLNQQIQSEGEWAAVATSPQARVIQLAPTPAGSAPAGSAQLHARVTYDPATRRAIVSVSDFVAPAGKDYQLWAITKTGPSSLGLVRADSQGRATLRLTDAGDPAALDAFAVSLEQEGGAPTTYAPAGPVVMVGKIGS